MMSFHSKVLLFDTGWKLAMLNDNYMKCNYKWIKMMTTFFINQMSAHCCGIRGIKHLENMLLKETHPLYRLRFYFTPPS